MVVIFPDTKCVICSIWDQCLGQGHSQGGGGLSTEPLLAIPLIFLSLATLFMWSLRLSINLNLIEPIYKGSVKHAQVGKTNTCMVIMEDSVPHSCVHELNSPVSQYERPRVVALASSACVDKTTKIITEFTRKDPFLHLKQAN